MSKASLVLDLAEFPEDVRASLEANARVVGNTPEKHLTDLLHRRFSHSLTAPIIASAPRRNPPSPQPTEQS